MLDHRLKGVSIVVAGAGLAGLSAAYDLTRRGADVTVVESRGRAGGRVFTVRDAFGGGQHAEGGGDLIESEHEAVRHIASELGLELVPILPGGFGFVRHVAGGGVEPLASNPWGPFTAALDPLIRMYRLADERWDGPIAAALARASVADWLNQQHASEDLRATARGMRGFFLADPDDLSLLPVIAELGTGGSPGDPGMYRIRGGNDLIAQRLASTLSRPIVLNAALSAASQDAHKVRVKLTEAGRALTELTADYLVVSVPARLARGVDWTPRLPDAQYEAMARLKYGFATKTLLQFDRRFWQRPGTRRAFGTDLAIGAVWDGNEEQEGAEGIVSLLAGGSTSNATASLVERGGMAALVNELRWLGSAGARLVAHHTVRWEDDPWAGGGYAYFDRSYAPERRQWLARPFGRVLFAGEHTSINWQGYMNGAIESGLRAAAEVAALTAPAPAAPN